MRTRAQESRRATSGSTRVPLVRRRTRKRTQPKLTLGAPGDAFELEADRVAEQVMRMPETSVASAPAGPGGVRSIQRKCATCAAAEAAGRPAPCPACTGRGDDETIRRRPDGVGASGSTALDATTSATIRGLGDGGGVPLPARERAYFEPRFGRSFGGVRVHTGPEAVQASRAIHARAFTYGHSVAFGAGQYAPGTAAGRRLLAHELTHVVQQGAAPALADRQQPVRRTTKPTIQGDWIINNHARRATAGGATDGDLVEQAFQQICPMASRSGNRIVFAYGPPPPNRMEGCHCLYDIEGDLASKSPVLKGTPQIELAVDGWSSTAPWASPPIVNPRHPQGSFGWGYWTGGQTRSLKPFFRTVAHEICGHVVTWVRTGGTHGGGRRSTTGHNEAIKGENRIAAEHGVAVRHQRGLDRDPKTGKPLRGHRGESFLQATVTGFAHGNASTGRTNLSTVVTDAVNTIKTVNGGGLALMVQVEGFALRNEGNTVARARAKQVRAALARALSVVRGLQTPAAGRFQATLSTVQGGTSVVGRANTNRRVQVYLFHKLHSAGP